MRLKKLELEWKHHQIKLNQVCLIHDPRGRVGPQYGIKIYLKKKNIEKIFKNLKSLKD